MRGGRGDGGWEKGERGKWGSGRERRERGGRRWGKKEMGKGLG